MIAAAPYIESITRQSEGECRNASPGHYAHLWVRVSPRRDYEANEILFDASLQIPDVLLGGVRVGLEAAFESGISFGVPLKGLEARIIDGSWHTRDSSAIDFERAASSALRTVVQNAGPVLLEALIDFEISSAEECAGTVIGILNKHRATLRNIAEDTPCHVQISCSLPLAERRYVRKKLAACEGVDIIAERFSGYRPTEPDDPDGNEPNSAAAGAA